MTEKQLQLVIKVAQRRKNMKKAALRQVKINAIKMGVDLNDIDFLDQYNKDTDLQSLVNDICEDFNFWAI